MFNERYPCPICERFHSIRECTKFIVLPIMDKRRKVVALKLCRNCLAQSHLREKCGSQDRCVLCKREHHSLLHPMSKTNVWFPMTATVRFHVEATGSKKEVRVLIDPNRAKSCITQATVMRYRCQVRQGYTTVKLQHRKLDRPTVEIRCAVLDTDLAITPVKQVKREWRDNHPLLQDVHDADQWWWRQYCVFLVLGADVAHKVFQGPAVVKLDHISIQPTVFGPAYFGEGEPDHYQRDI